MVLIIGLGNPGKKYEKTRHNIGFQAVDEIAANFQFPIFNFQSIFNAQTSKGKINGQNVILAKPQTFMNLSGKSVKLLIKTYKIKPVANFSDRLNKRQRLGLENLWVVHDDIDLPLGKIRISIGQGAAGHKGVESIIREIGTKNFVRFRAGIQPKQTDRPIYNTEKFVLQRVNKEKEKIVKEVIEKTVKAVEFALKEGLEKAMSEFNQ